MFNQPGLERALRAKLEVSPLADVRLGACLAGVSVTAEGVEARVEEAEDPLLIKARFLVGCDGASSGVRETIGGGLEDLEFDEPWLVVDVIPRPGSTLPEVNLQICNPDRPITCVQSGPGRHRWEIMLRPGEVHETVLNDGFIRAELAKFGVDVEIERKAVYRFHGLIARRWRRGPVLIAGDAAHQTPPFAGQGLCAGIRDAANLAWKLNGVLQGDGGETLLDTYQTEREPNVRAYIQHAIDMGRVVCTTDPEAARRRDERMLAARRAGLPAILPAAPPPLSGPCVLDGAPGAGEVFPQPVSEDGGALIRLDDRLGLHSWLIGTPPRTAPPPGVDCVSLQDPRIAPFRAALAAWLERHEAPAVLVRPDRYIFGSCDPDRLTRAWSSALGALPAVDAV
jgi:3-(3-hydroxy-phenyl)propionate hydroxylase